MTWATMRSCRTHGTLYHFDVDEDIRATEPGYHERQIKALKEILEELVVRESKAHKP